MIKEPDFGSPSSGMPQRKLTGAPVPAFSDIKGPGTSMPVRDKMLVLVVDDEPQLREITARILKHAGYQVLSGGTAAETLSMARANRPALVLLDVDLPDGNGVEVARILKEDPVMNGILVILVSGKKFSPEDQAKGLSMGLADGYIVRPVSNAELLARINAFARIFSAQEAHRQTERKLMALHAEVEATVRERTAELAAANEALKAEIEEHRKAEEALKTSQDRLRTALHAAQAGVWEWDIQSGRDYWSEELWELYGLVPHSCEPSYSSWQKIVHPDDLLGVVETIHEASRTGKPYHIEWRLKDANDAERWMTSYGKPVFDDGKLTRFIGIVLDITERKKTEDKKNLLETQLQQSRKMEAIGTLAGGIAHDLNNILYPILGLAETLMEDFPPDGTEYECLLQIKQSAIRGSNLVKQILAFSRKSVSCKIPLRIQPIIKEVLKLMRPALPGHIEFTADVDPDCGKVLADSTQIYQILTNLITNALHAVEEGGGAICLRLQEAAIENQSPSSTPSLPPGRYACIRVSDTGAGMSKTLIDRIFEPYFTTKKQGKGTGLGLSVVQGIVMESGGDIQVRSQAGAGTECDVYLPILEDAFEDQSAEIIGKYPTGDERVMLIDDEVAVLQVEQRMLEKLGYRITTCTDSLDALARFKAAPGDFDLVISDRGMPHIPGDRLAAEILAIRPDIPIILCSGYCREEDEGRMADIGVKRLIFKPVNKRDLAVTVRTVLSRS